MTTSRHSHFGKSIKSPEINNKGEQISSALLATAIVRIELNGQVSKPLRALCDTGAQINFISDNAVRSLKWPTQQCSIRIHGIGNAPEKSHSRKLTCQLLSRMSCTSIQTIDLIVGPNLSKLWLPDQQIPETVIPSEVLPNLADPGACVPSTIDILLGAGVWAAVIRDGSIVSPQGIAFQPSTLGWLMYGGGSSSFGDLTNVIGVTVTNEPQLDQMLMRFWETEEIEVARIRTVEHERCEDIFMKKHLRLLCGRFQVDIPLREGIDQTQLGSSRAIALHRFLQLERRFKRDPELKAKYFAAINELLCNGQMKLADRPPNELYYYIPHHPVLKKFRIVNDASCKTDRGISLNDVQLVGEKLQDNLADLIMRFRCHPVAVTADIKKMYLQVRINPKQWDLQRIFWRPDENTAIKEYWLTVVTFGLSSAPHCAVRAMIQGAREAKGQYPIGAEVVEHDFYIDDCLTGADTDAEARQLSEEIDKVLRSSGFVLDKWRSNRPNVVPICEQGALDLGEFEDTTVLGLRWLPTTDELMFKFKLHPVLEVKEATKRKLLSRIAKIFDPNGYIGPVVVKAKILMQKIWSANIGWDSLVPDNIYREWRRFEQQLPLVTEIRLPRWLGIKSDRNISLHGFADASTVAYGAALYVRVETKDQILCTLIAAKSRVAPLKTITIPLLELSAALMLSELVRTFKKTAKHQYVKTTLWSDSQIVLAWLKKDSATLKIFVNNRIQKIQQLTADTEWRYISSIDNPADQLSRGTSVAQLRDSRLWWNGPLWLRQIAIHWPNYQLKTTSTEDSEIAKEEKFNDRDSHFRQYHKEIAMMSVTLRGVNLLERASKMFQLCRLSAWLFRFMHNIRVKKEYRWKGPLSNKEIKTAQEFWVHEEQQLYYSKEIKALKNEHDKSIDPLSPIANCTPWLDNKGLLRLGGRLGRAPIPIEQKYPILLPDVSPLAKLVIREAHERSLHGGPNETMAFVRRRFWITNLRRAVRKHNWDCVICTRHRHQATTQMMSELPTDRVTPCRPFSHTGVDYAGPYLLKARGGRCNIIEKKYIAVFVCMVTKAVHLELVESLSTADFIQAFLRFTSIRGACLRLWSDNGKNFEGAAIELKKMLRSWNEMDMAKALQKYGTEWRFITPAAPHQGGLWEACVKSMKYHLRRVIGPHKLTSSEFQTVLAQTSAVMNSRPLSALTEDPEDLSFLTPAHFLIGEPIIQPFGANVSEIPDNRLKSPQRIQKMTQVFWKAWAQDYLHQLHQRTKWRQPQPNLKTGDLVIIREENVPPTFWKTARVIETFAGADGLVRNVRLRVASSDWKLKPREKKVPFIIWERPIQKLFRLPIETESEAEHSRGECVAATNLFYDLELSKEPS
ncbi:uncharacterized protein LOC129913326 [Episyrphus balteatus]|uniref:uncharacterized protein LOC129913326 n=1 Tax=Episyrphus balteatus TaxID=286459 RepID=UPI002484D940|nr:uncharacterized protein LOC129913326 [Episyrphus balteatus]